MERVKPSMNLLSVTMAIQPLVAVRQACRARGFQVTPDGIGLAFPLRERDPVMEFPVRTPAQAADRKGTTKEIVIWKPVKGKKEKA